MNTKNVYIYIQYMNACHDSWKTVMLTPHISRKFYNTFQKIQVELKDWKILADCSKT